MITVTEIDAPDAWASYLVNGDSSGLEAEDIAACDAWLAKHAKAGKCVGVQEDCYYGQFNGLLTLLFTYEFVSR